MLPLKEKSDLSKNQIKELIENNFTYLYQYLERVFKNVKLDSSQKTIFLYGIMAVAKKESTWGTNTNHGDGDHGIMGLREATFKYFVCYSDLKEKLKEKGVVSKCRKALSGKDVKTAVELLEYDEELNIKVGAWYYGQKFFEIKKNKVKLVKSSPAFKDQIRKFGDYAIAVAAYSQYWSGSIQSDTHKNLVQYKDIYNDILASNNQAKVF